MIRTFIALDLPSAVRDAVRVVQNDLRLSLRNVAVSWTRIEGIHLTVKFLGDIDDTAVPAIGECLKEIAQRVEPIHLEVRGVSVFPELTNPRVIWLGLQGEVERLQQLQQDVDATLEARGFSRESRSFHPHLTLGRFRGRFERGSQAREAFRVAIESRSAVQIPGFMAESMILFTSDLQRGGAVYTPLVTASFSS